MVAYWVLYAAVKLVEEPLSSLVPTKYVILIVSIHRVGR